MEIGEAAVFRGRTDNPIEAGNPARPAAVDHREHPTAETAESEIRPSRNPRLTGTLPLAEGRVKRNLPGFEAGEDQTGQTGPSAPAMRAPACRQAGSGMGRSSKRSS